MIFMMMSPQRIIFLSLLMFTAVSCCHIDKTVKQEYQAMPVDSSTAGNDYACDTLIMPYTSKISDFMNTIIGYSDTSMSTGKPEGLLGNFLADLLLETVNTTTSRHADMGLFNNGGFRVPIAKGPVSKAAVFKLMPFENELVIVSMEGFRVKEMLDFIAMSGGQPVSGVRAGINKKGASDIFIGGIPIDTAKTYMVLTSDYLANGGDKMSFFLKCNEVLHTGMKVRDVIMDYIASQYKMGNKISAKLDGRLYPVKE